MKELECEEKQDEWVIQSCKNTAEEKMRQRKKWRKRKQEQRMANSMNTTGSQLPLLNREQIDFLPSNPDALICIAENKKKQASSLNQSFAPENVKKPRFAVLKPGSGEKKMDMASSSRGAMMVHMVVGADAVVAHKTKKPHQRLIAIQTTIANSKCKFEPKELTP